MTPRSNLPFDTGGIACALSRIQASPSQAMAAFVNGHMDILWANGTFLNTLGLPATGNDVRNLSDLPLFIEWLDDIRLALTSGTPCIHARVEEGRATVSGLDLSAIPWCLCPMREGNGSIAGAIFLATTLEIPEEGREAPSHFAQDHLTLLDAMSDTVLIVDPATSQIMEANRNAEILLGYSREEIRGMRVDELSSEAAAYSREEVMRRLARLVAGEPQLFEWRFKKRNGTGVWVEVNAQGAVLEDRPCVISSIRDITGRKETEEELLKIRGALDDCGSAVIMTGKEGKAVYLNAAFGSLFGCTEDRIAEVMISNYFADKTTGEGLLRTIVAGGSWEREVLMIDKAKRTFPAAVRGTPVLDEDYDVSGCLLILNDVTERRQLEAQLMQAQNLKSVGQLAAGIAHEINTPIQYVGDNVRFLRDSFSSLLQVVEECAALVERAASDVNCPLELHEMKSALEKSELDYLKEEVPLAVGQSLEGINRVTEIIRAMRQFTHPGTSDKKSVDLNAAIENTILIARNEWKYVAEVKTDFEPDLPLVPCFPGDLNQVFLNLIVNAAQAIAQKLGNNLQEKGLITVSTARDGENVEIRVTDTGVGIPEEIRDHVFDPFFTTKDVGKGTGQGLAISHAVVVEKHKGQLYFKSEAGKGTTFIIRIPLEDNDPQDNSREIHA